MYIISAYSNLSIHSTIHELFHWLSNILIHVILIYKSNNRHSHCWFIFAVMPHFYLLMITQSYTTSCTNPFSSINLDCIMIYWSQKYSILYTVYHIVALNDTTMLSSDDFIRFWIVFWYEKQLFFTTPLFTIDLYSHGLL